MYSDILEKELNVILSEEQKKQFKNYYNELVSYNSHTNLTRITDEKEVYIKHFLDSLLLKKLVDFNEIKNLCDMGAGAGFPSVPLLILFPHLKVTIVESQIKRVNFLNHLKDKIMVNFEIIHDRAENFSRKNQEKFDCVTARALGELNLILEYGVPLLKKDGFFIAPKGSKYLEEIENAQKAMKTLCVEIVKKDTFELVENSGFRSNLLLKKHKHVPGYPRDYAKIIKAPL